MSKRLTPFRFYFMSCRTGFKRIGRDPLKNHPDPAVSSEMKLSVHTLRTPPTAGAYPCSCGLKRSAARVRYLWFPRIWQLTFCESVTAVETWFFRALTGGWLTCSFFIIYYLFFLLYSLSRRRIRAPRMLPPRSRMISKVRPFFSAISRTASDCCQPCSRMRVPVSVRWFL